LEVLCSDPGALHDIPAWCRIHGHSITNTVHDLDGLIRITVLVHKQ
jgi:tRNA 2-thiouridine synthesizing protein A